jgi:DMSO/TMAO reductase YedYZ molybdopterin-dependent catalytic subunit
MRGEFCLELQRRLHRLLAPLFLVLLLSGASLYNEALRTRFAEYRFAIHWIHLLAGIGFSLTFLANLPYCWRNRQGTGSGPNRAGLLLALLVVALTSVMSGLVLLVFPFAGWSGPAINLIHTVHIGAAVASIWLVLPHLLHATRRRPQAKVPVAVTTKKQPSGQSRRGFLRYLLGGTLVAAAFGLWKWLGQQAANIKTETLAAFAQCNRMSPPPKPLPDSSPPKGGGYTGKFKVYKIERDIPCTDSASWQFKIGGLVDKPITFRWEDFLKLPRTVQVSDFHCVEGWSVYRITYEGVRLADLLNVAGVKPEARYVKFYSAERVYTDALSLEQARLTDVMAAVLIDGGEIPSDLGGPVRLVVPQMFAYKAVKWLIGMELVATPYKGYWEERGYPVDAWIKPQQNKGGA